MTDGTAIWTPAHLFHAGDVALYNGPKCTTRWHTGKQAPPTSNGPWAIQS